MTVGELIERLKDVDHTIKIIVYDAYNDMDTDNVEVSNYGSRGIFIGVGDKD